MTDGADENPSGGPLDGDGAPEEGSDASGEPRAADEPAELTGEDTLDAAPSSASSDESAEPMTREAARDRAKELRARHRRRERLRLGALVLGIIVIVAGLGATIASVIFFVPAKSPAGPLNMAGDAVRITQEGTVRGPAASDGGIIGEPAPEPSDGVLDIRVYVDFLSAESGAFLRNEAESISAWIEAGTAELEIHPLAMLTTQSAGTQYSLRAANALGCVVNYVPDAALGYVFALVEDQPEEGSEGLSDEELIARADAVIRATEAEPTAAPSAPANADSTPPPAPVPTASATPGATESPAASPAVVARVATCIEEQRFRPWVIAATNRAVKGPLPGTSIPSVADTPLILVEGREFVFNPLSSGNDFRQFVLQISGEVFVTPTPTPSATPTPTPTSTR